MLNTFFQKTIAIFCFGLMLASTQIYAKPSKEQLRIGLSQEFENMNPIISQMSATKYIYHMVGRTLITLNSEGKWVPKLAKAVPSFENNLAEIYDDQGTKKIRAEFEIKENATWGDGTPITGHDVEFSWRVGNHENVSVGSRDVYSRVEKIIIDSKNPKKFTFLFEKARWDFYQLAGFHILPKHLEEPVFKKYGGQKEGYDKNSLYNIDPSNRGLYSGPYIVAEIKLGSHVTLKKNPNFYGKSPYFESIVNKVIPNTSAMEANLLSDTIDMISSLGPTFDQALSIDKRMREKKLPYKVIFRQGLLYEHIDLQLANPILQDVQVRKALVYGISREDLVNALFEGKQKMAIHNISPIDAWYTDDPDEVVRYPYSRRKAKKLLKQAGWKVGADGYRYKDGKKLSLQLMTTAGNKTRELVEVWLQEQWRKIGIEISIKNEPARVYFGETVRKGTYPALAMYAWMSAPERNPRSTLSSENIPTKENGYAGQNSMHWSNSEVDRLVEELDTTFNAEKRKELAGKILYQYTNEIPVIPLYYRSNVSVVPEGLEGYKLSPHQYHSTTEIENWHLK